VVIGETAEIGDDVLIYQGVTLGGTSLKKEKRHPTLEDHVMVSAGASVIGPVRIGRGSRIGAGAVVVSSAPPYSTIVGIPGKVIEGESARQDVAELDHARLPDPVARAMSGLIEKINQLQTRLSEIEERQDCLEDKFPAVEHPIANGIAKES
jgi:serine O-acetyltransferase